MTAKGLGMSLVVFGLVLLAAGFLYGQRPPSATLSLVERCVELGGEWLYNSNDKICTLPSGEWLAYSLSADDFLPRGAGEQAAPEVLAVSDECSARLSFADFSTEDSYSGRAQVDFSTNDEAKHYRTAISKDVARGVNFAGQYVLSMWGCGDGCVGSAVINAESGKILSYGLTSAGYEFELGSRLLDVEGQGYYVVEGDELIKRCNL